jgi:taurine dioxygenase
MWLITVNRNRKWMRVMKSDFTTQPLAIGCSVLDFDMTALTNRQKQKLLRPLYQSRLIVLKNQRVSDQQFVDFSRVFGRPESYLQDTVRHPRFPLISVATGGTTEGNTLWQADTAFEAEPKGITMLMPTALPQPEATMTKFIDMAEVYKALPEATKERLAGARFIHSNTAQAGGDAPKRVIHPAVLAHPGTGEKILYANRRFTIGVADCAQEEGDALLAEVLDFAESSRFIREVCWEMGDIILWDNRFLVHRPAQICETDEPATMLRITTRDSFAVPAGQMALAA